MTPKLQRKWIDRVSAVVRKQLMEEWIDIRHPFELKVTVSDQPTSTFVKRRYQIVRDGKYGSILYSEGFLSLTFDPIDVKRAWDILGSPMIAGMVVLEARQCSHHGVGQHPVYRLKCLARDGKNRGRSGLSIQDRYLVLTHDKGRLVNTTVGAVKSAWTRWQRVVSNGNLDLSNAVIVTGGESRDVRIARIDSVTKASWTDEGDLCIEARIDWYNRGEGPARRHLFETERLFRISEGRWLWLMPGLEEGPGITLKDAMSIQRTGALPVVEEPHEPPADILPEDEAAFTEMGRWA